MKKNESTEMTPLSMESALQLTGKKAINFWCDKDNVQPLIEFVQTEASSLIPDVSTKKGRDAIGSNALKVSKARKVLEEAITKSISDAQSLVNQGKLVKKHVTESLNATRIEILKPRDEWQKAEDEKEQKRVNEIKTRINNIRVIGEIQGVKTKEDLAKAIDSLEAMDVSEGFEEFTQDAMKAKNDAIQSLNAAINAIVQHDLQQQAKLDLERQQKDIKIGERLQKLQGIPASMFGSNSSDINTKIDALKSNEPKLEDFEDRHGEAMASFNTVLEQLEQMFDQKVQIEEMQANQLKEDQAAPVPTPPAEEDLPAPTFPNLISEEDAQVFDDCIADAKPAPVHEACTDTVKSDTCRGCPDCKGIGAMITQDETEKAKSLIKALMPDQYKDYIDNHLAGDFAFHLAVLLQK